MELIRNTKTTLITGGTSGIGFEMAKILLLQGYHVGVVGLDENKTEKSLIELLKIAPHCRAYTYDLSNHNQCKALVTQVLNDFEQIDVLVNNAGYGTYETFEDSSFDEIERLLAVNLSAHVLITKLILPSMIKTRSGAIINVASVAGKMVITPNATYCGAKHAIVGWSKALSYELKRFNISVKIVCPGRVETEFFNHPTFLKREVRSEMKSSISAPIAAKAIVKFIQKSNKFAFYIPKKYVLIEWIYRVVPFVEFLFQKLMTSRINDYYQSSKPSEEIGPKV